MDTRSSYVTVSNAVNATLYEKLGFDVIHDMVPIASITRSPGVLVVNRIFSSKDASRVHRVCQSQSRQDQYGVSRAGERTASLHRVV